MPLKDSTETKMGCQERRGGRMGSWSDLVFKRDVQHLIKNVSTIACFISRYTDYLKPFFNVIKKAKAFEWTVKCEETFLVIKKKTIWSHPQF